MEKEGTEGALPGLGLTEEQLFFAGFARVGIPMLVALFTRVCVSPTLQARYVQSHNQYLLRRFLNSIKTFFVRHGVVFTRRKQLFFNLQLILIPILRTGEYMFDVFFIKL